MNYIDTKYVSLIGPRLRNFSKKKDYLWNFSCPYCGDSSKKKNKARGFVYRTKNDLFYKCHNCAMGTTVAKLIEFVDANLYKEYVMERYKEGTNGTPYKGGYKTPKPQFNFKSPKFKSRLGDLKTFAELEENHPAVKFLSDRSLPRDAWNDIYFCPKFFEFTNTQVQNKFPSLDGDHPRMIIPFRKENGQIFAFQGRSFGDEKMKYITIILDTEYPKIFGMDRLNPNDNIYVTEGPFDSLFISNAIAVAQSDLRVPQFKDKAVLVPDNEPRNQEICRQIERCIEEGYKVCLWPNTIKEKDINDMILSGMTQAEVLGIIHSNSHSGLKAQTVFNSWKRTY